MTKEKVKFSTVEISDREISSLKVKNVFSELNKYVAENFDYLQENNLKVFVEKPERLKSVGGLATSLRTNFKRVLLETEYSKMSYIAHTLKTVTNSIEGVLIVIKK